MIIQVAYFGRGGLTDWTDINRIIPVRRLVDLIFPLKLPFLAFLEVTGIHSFFYYHFLFLDLLAY